MTTYTASVTREGRWWMVHVPEIDEVTTQARRVSEIEKMARELIAVTLDVPMSQVTVNLRIEKVGNVDCVTDKAEAIQAEKQEGEELVKRASAKTADLARALAEADVPYRDIGTILGVSYQRAHQLVSH